MTELVFDMGQTGTRVRIHDAESTVELALPGFRYGGDLGSAIFETAASAAHSSGLSRIDTLSGGCTGLHGSVPELDALAHQLRSALGTTRLVIADDAVTSHLGTFAGRPGVLAAVGTGLVAFGLGEDASARVDGVGFMAGDDGAGWWIGRRGLIAAFSAHDGRAGGSEALLDALVATHGPIEQVPGLLASQESPIGTVARFARVVADVARDGDSVAVGIWREAAAHIGNALTAAARRSEQSAGFEWAVTGGLTQAKDLLDSPVSEAVQAEFPSARHVDARGTSLDGAFELLRMPSIHHLSPFVGEYPNR